MRSRSGSGDRRATLTLFAGIALTNVVPVAALFLRTRERRDAV